MKNFILIFLIIFVIKDKSYCQNLSVTNGSRNDSLLKQEVYLYNGLMKMMIQNHISPPNIDDSLSNHIYNQFLLKLDPDKNIFLQKDIDTIRYCSYLIIPTLSYSFELNFYQLVKSIYIKRVKEISNYSFLTNIEKFKFQKQENSLINNKWSTSKADKKKRWINLISNQFYYKKSELSKGISNISYRNKKAKIGIYKKYNSWINKMIDAGETAIFSIYLNSICSIYDPHTEYMPTENKIKFDQMMSNSFYGVGIQLGLNNQEDIVIKKIIKGMSASKSKKLSEGNVLLSISQGENGNWFNVEGVDLQEISQKIKGKENTYVRLLVRNVNTSKVSIVSLRREKIDINQASVRSAIIHTENNKKIGFIYIPEFYHDYNSNNGKNCADDVKNELISINKKNVNSLIIDLRNNGGGSLSDVVKIVGYFIKSGPVVQVKDNKGNVDILFDNDSSMIFDKPMAIIINSQIASASEIFAAALQDYNRSVIIGTNSFGKGTVQRQFSLGKMIDGEPEFGALKLTIQKFYRITGKTTQKWGVTPDIFIPNLYNYFPNREKNYSYVLMADTIKRANYLKYDSYVYKKINYLDYTFLKKEDKLDLQLADSYKLNSKNIYSVNDFQKRKQSELVEKISKLDILDIKNKLKFEPNGKFKDEYWYKDWMNELSLSKNIKLAQYILL